MNTPSPRRRSGAEKTAAPLSFALLLCGCESKPAPPANATNAGVTATVLATNNPPGTPNTLTPDEFFTRLEQARFNAHSNGWLIGFHTGRAGMPMEISSLAREAAYYGDDLRMTNAIARIVEFYQTNHPSAPSRLRGEPLQP